MAVSTRVGEAHRARANPGAAIALITLSRACPCSPRSRGPCPARRRSIAADDVAAPDHDADLNAQGVYVRGPARRGPAMTAGLDAELPSSPARTLAGDLEQDPCRIAAFKIRSAVSPSLIAHEARDLDGVRRPAPSASRPAAVGLVTSGSFTKGCSSRQMLGEELVDVAPRPSSRSTFSGLPLLLGLRTQDPPLGLLARRGRREHRRGRPQSACGSVAATCIARSLPTASTASPSRVGATARRSTPSFPPACTYPLAHAGAVRR